MKNDGNSGVNRWLETGMKSHRGQKVPSAVSRLSRRIESPGYEAMNRVAHFLATRPDLPDVQMGSITPEEVALTFTAQCDLPSPFRKDDPDEDGEEAAPFTWVIGYDETQELDGAPGRWASQLNGVLLFGENSHGHQLMLNTAWSQIIGALGDDEFLWQLMVGLTTTQMMQPWNVEQQIVLVGYGEVADELKIALRDHHPIGNVYAFDSVDDITEDFLQGLSATVYVMGATEDEVVDRLHPKTNTRTGIIADCYIERGLQIADEGDGDAAIDPMNFPLRPPLVARDSEVMELVNIAYEFHRQKEEEAAEGLTEESFEAFLADLNDPVDPAARESEASGDEQAEPEGSETGHRSAEREEEPEDESPAEVHPSQEDKQGNADLQLLGRVQILSAEEGEPVTGQVAEVAALLHLSGHRLEAESLSEAIWPLKETSGHAARTRRSRLKQRVSAAVTVDADHSAWVISPLTSDHEQIMQTLSAEGERENGPIVDALRRVERPLEGCGAWADEHRQRMVTALSTVLEPWMNHHNQEIAEAAAEATGRISS